VIEKHLTLDKALPGPDHRASADSHEFTAMVAAIRKLESMLGDGVKRPHPIEMNTRDVARRSIVVVRNLLQGHRLEEDDLALRRPGTGLQPSQWGDVVGGELVRDMLANTTLTAAMLRTKKD
jgi:sialic acid synthase SpsE